MKTIQKEMKKTVTFINDTNSKKVHRNKVNQEEEIQPGGGGAHLSFQPSGGSLRV